MSRLAISRRLRPRAELSSRAMSASAGMVAAGHPQTAEVGAEVLRSGGNAVDAAVACVLASWVCEPLLTGPGAGGYMLVAGAGEEPTLLDFFVAAPGAGTGASPPSALVPLPVDFGGAKQTFNVGAASCGVPGMTCGLEAATRRFGTAPLDELAAPAARLARRGVALNAPQAYVFDLLGAMLVGTPQARAEFAPDGRPLRAGEAFRSPLLAETIERLGAEGAAPFTGGDIAGAIADHVAEHGGLLNARDLAAYAPAERSPAPASYRGRRILTNPPPSAGGILLALAFDLLEQRAAAGPPDAGLLAEIMVEVQALRTPQFVAGLDEPGFLERFLGDRLGSTTHISVLDGDGRACSVTCTNGTGSGVVVPDTGIHLNNIMGEEDLNPLGFFRSPPGRRMPSMMSPTVVLDEHGTVELVVGSAGSNRIRSAILQVVVNVVDRGLSAGDAVDAPRLHVEDGVVYTEPGIDAGAIEARGRRIMRFAERNLFFGGAQAVERDRASGLLSGGGDPRRDGAAVAA
jgi:gamma-glutamyltranspeptidase/glutathione hydrolase